MAVEGGEPVETRVFVVGPDVRFGVVSDIDDTVMVTALPRPLLAAWNSFVVDEHARQPVPGMAVLMERIVRENPGAPVIYLSTGAWNIAPTLIRFLRRHLFPPGSILLTDWGPTHDRWFRSGRAHKLSNLRRLAAEFPEVKWLLIGDDGQHDEEIYTTFTSEQPEQRDRRCDPSPLPRRGRPRGGPHRGRGPLRADGAVDQGIGRCGAPRATRRSGRPRRPDVGGRA